MKPRLLNLAAGVSLLLALAIVALWVRSCWRWDRLSRGKFTSTDQYTIIIDSGRGELGGYSGHTSGKFHATEPTYGSDSFPVDAINTLPPRGYPFPWPPLRSRILRTPGPGSEYTRIIIAYWLLLLPTLPLPIIAIVRHRRRRHRETSNLCPNCGYDLRATPDRCPECGLDALPRRRNTRNVRASIERDG